MENKIIPFNLAFRPSKEGEIPALWLEVKGVDYLINPFALVESIDVFGDICPLILANPWEMKKRVFSISVISKDDYENHRYIWIVRLSDGTEMTWYFSDEEYEAKLLVQVSELGRHVLKNGLSGYGVSLSKIDAGNLMAQLLQSKYYSGWKGIKGIPKFEEEHFSMALLEEEDGYEVKIGDKTIVGYVEYWEASFAAWREALEHYLFKGECELEIYYECDPVTFVIKSVHFLDHTVTDETGMYFNYGDTVLVSVNPDRYTEQGIVVAFCREYELIRGIYSALFELATRWDSVEPDDDGESRRVKMFSPKVENYLVRNYHGGNLKAAEEFCDGNV